MSYETFYSLTVYELGYWLQQVAQREIDIRKWQAKVAHFEVVNNAVAFHSPKSLPSLEKSFPSLFKQQLTEDEQEARFIAQAKQYNQERGFE